MFGLIVWFFLLMIGAVGGVDEPVRFVGVEKVDLAPHEPLAGADEAVE